MKIDIQAKDFVLTNPVRSYVERRLRFALTCREDHIQCVVVRLSQSDCGVKKRCDLQVVLTGLSNVAIEYTELDLNVAIGHAVDHAARTVLRKIERGQAPLGPTVPVLSN